MLDTLFKLKVDEEYEDEEEDSYNISMKGVQESLNPHNYPS
jgi:hypothetical protein